MWKFLTEVLRLLKSVNWKKVLSELQKIPHALKCTVLVAVSVWCTYFGYQKFVDADDIKTLQEEVDELQEKVNASVESQDYKDDLVYLISAIKVLEATQQYAYQEEQDQLTLIKRFIEKEHPGDPIISDIDAMYERNELEYTNMRLQFQHCIQSCGLKTVQDSICAGTTK